MEQKETMAGMLDLILRPAFCVKDGVIVRVNQAAESILITAGTPVSELLLTGITEYPEFSDGCLYLTLTVQGTPCGASVTRLETFDVFTLDLEDEQTELQAMALAAQELRQPLHNIMATADCLFPVIGDDANDVSREQIASINKGLFQLHRIINNMSDAHRYSRFTGSGQEERNICAILDAVFSTAAAAIQHADVELRFTNMKGAVYSLVDEEKLERAVNNILGNALKFTPRGGVIEAKLTRRGDMLYLTIQDSGSGVEEKLRSSVFSRFARQPGLEDSRHGIGLGMVLIRSAAAQHGGTVLLEHLPDSGTRLTMTLEIRHNRTAMVRSGILRVDYAGERDHRLVELSESLPVHLYELRKSE